MNRKQAYAEVNKKIIKTDVVLDIGCGIRPQTYLKPVTHICVEPFGPYIERLRQEHTGDSRYIFLHCMWFMAASVLPDKSVDTVFILDMIEHIEKEEGHRMLKEAERVARKQVIIFTPLGFMPQSHEDGADRWGMAGGYWQTHRSGWTPADFGEDWECIVCEDFHHEDQHGKMEKPFGAFWAIKTFNGATLGKIESAPERKRLRFNFGIGRNMLIRSFFIASLYGVINTVLIKTKLLGFKWIDMWPFVALPLWWMLDYFVIWRQEVDANFLASKEWQRHEEKIDEIKNELSRLSKES